MKRIIALAVIVLCLFCSCTKAEIYENTTECGTGISEIASLEEETTQAEHIVTATTEKATVTTTSAALTSAASETTAKKAEKTTAPTKKSDSVTISINCSDILGHMDKLKDGKEYFVPSDGVILKSFNVKINDGDTVFDVLKSACEKNNIRLEYTFSSGFGSYYIEGINQLYEKDCGSKSGWLYTVNGSQPDVGCSSYKVKNGDTILFNYTCEMY